MVPRQFPETTIPNVEGKFQYSFGKGKLAIYKNN